VLSYLYLCLIAGFTIAGDGGGMRNVKEALDIALPSERRENAMLYHQV
jgi:hypothetical protein